MYHILRSLREMYVCVYVCARVCVLFYVFMCVRVPVPVRHILCGGQIPLLYLRFVQPQRHRHRVGGCNASVVLMQYAGSTVLK